MHIIDKPREWFNGESFLNILSMLREDASFFFYGTTTKTWTAPQSLV